MLTILAILFPTGLVALLIQLLIFVIVIGIILAIVNHFWPLGPLAQKIVGGVILIIILLWILEFFV